ATQAQRPYQGHQLRELTTSDHEASRRFPAGTYLVRTDQPLGTLAGYLLSDRAEDGLATWNSFDAMLKEGTDSPIARLMRDEPLTTGRARQLAEERTFNRRITPAVLGVAGPNFSGNLVTVSDWIDDDHYLQVKGGRLRVIDAATGRSK